MRSRRNKTPTLVHSLGKVVSTNTLGLWSPQLLVPYWELMSRYFRLSIYDRRKERNHLSKILGNVFKRVFQGTLTTDISTKFFSVDT